MRVIESALKAHWRAHTECIMCVELYPGVVTCRRGRAAKPHDPTMHDPDSRHPRPAGGTQPPQSPRPAAARHARTCFTLEFHPAARDARRGRGISVKA